MKPETNNRNAPLPVGSGGLLGAPVTIVYEIKDESEWQKTNPLRYEHNGLKAHTVAAYDAVEERNAYREELLRLRDVVCKEDVEIIDRVLSAPNDGLEPSARSKTYGSGKE